MIARVSGFRSTLIDGATPQRLTPTLSRPGSACPDTSRRYVRRRCPSCRWHRVRCDSRPQWSGDEAFDIRHTGRQLGDEVDRAAGRAAPERERRWPFVHFDTISVEQITRVPAWIADAIAEDIAPRGEATDNRGVALIAALARSEGDTRHRAQRVFHAGEALFLQHLLGDDVDRLRRVEQRRRKLRNRGAEA